MSLAGTRANHFLDDYLGLPRRDRRYLIYLILVALFGWALAAYDFNLLVFALPTVSSDLGLSATQAGLLVFIVYAVLFVITLFVGYAMDQKGRKWMWVFALCGAAIFTGLTYFVTNYWQFVAVRAIASGLANSELAISITLVNEQVPARRRGLLYSAVQGGWPVGVLMAAGVWLGLHQALGWHLVFVIGVVPLIFVILARTKVRESDRYLHVKEVKAAKKAGDEARLRQLLQRYDVDTSDVEQVTVKQIFLTPGWVRTQLIKTSIVWLAYAAAFTATNTYIIYWLTNFQGFSDNDSTLILLVASAGGWFFYVLGGFLGESLGRQRILIVSAAVLVALTALWPWLSNTVALWVCYFFIYQVSNGTWSGCGYAYWGESFPTRVRGTAIGWLGAMFSGGLLIGSGVWTALIGAFPPLIVWYAVALGFSVIQLALSFTLPHIPPGKELEEISI
ncbi:MAG: MFS transporter [Streptosporangiaceae bacterium]